MAEAEAGIYAREYPFLDRYVQLGVASGRVISVLFPEVPDEGAETEYPLLDRIGRYFDGVDEVEFADVEIGLTVPTDHRSVLETLRDVPYGEQVTVEELVRMTAGLDSSDEDDHETVRIALDGNPLPLLIPDHRVTDGPSAAPPEVEQRLRSVEGL